MAMIRCPICGEKYSDTYKECPFCEEEEALRDGEEIRRSPRRRGGSRSRQFSIVTPMLIILIIIMAALLIYLLRGDKLGGSKDSDKDPENTPPAQEEVIPGTEDPSTGGEVTMPEDETGTEAPSAMDFEEVMALPDGLTLSTTDFSLRETGESHTIHASGGSGTYSWVSQDAGVASVGADGKVTAISNGTINVVATDGTHKGVCIVRVKISGSSSTGSTGSTGGTTSSGTLKAGDATVVNGGNGVRVRSGPGTTYDILATVPNGAKIQVVEKAGVDDWYKIQFADVGGVTKDGYMKAEFLKNS